jgi:hypothetical protein
MKSNLVVFSLLFLVSCVNKSEHSQNTYYYDVTKVGEYTCIHAPSIGGIWCENSENKKEIAMLNVEIVRLQAELTKAKQ